ESAFSSEPSATSTASPSRLRRSLRGRASTRTGWPALTTARATAEPTNPVAPVTRHRPDGSVISASRRCSDPIADALHHRRFDAEIAVRRHRLTWIGLDLVARHNDDLLARRTGERRDEVRGIN